MNSRSKEDCVLVLETMSGSGVVFFELLYCECCGQLFFGGMRSQSARQGTELLPADPDPEALPDRAKSQLFEDLSADDFAVFWPTVSRYWPWGDETPKQDDAQGTWRRAVLDPKTGRAAPYSATRAWAGGGIPAYLRNRALAPRSPQVAHGR